jgi:hypothetical protein
MTLGSLFALPPVPPSAPLPSNTDATADAALHSHSLAHCAVTALSWQLVHSQLYKYYQYILGAENMTSSTMYISFFYFFPLKVGANRYSS